MSPVWPRNSWHSLREFLRLTTSFPSMPTGSVPGHHHAGSRKVSARPNSSVTPKAQGMLSDHLLIPRGLFITVEGWRKASLGDKTLKFIHTPWVHWPETMVSYLEEDKILFSCDFFGSHIASSDLFVTDEGRVYEAAELLLCRDHDAF